MLIKSWWNLASGIIPPFRRKYILCEKFDSSPTYGLQRNKDVILSLKRGFISVNEKKVLIVNVWKECMQTHEECSIFSSKTYGLKYFHKYVNIKIYSVMGFSLLNINKDDKEYRMKHNHCSISLCWCNIFIVTNSLVCYESSSFLSCIILSNVLNVS